MNYRIIFHTTGKVLLVEAGLLALPLLVSVLYHERCAWAVLASMAAAAVIGGLLTLLARPRRHTFFNREGYIIVALAWVLLSAVGALPFWFSREIPSYADAFFETVSGFTTTGASILTDVEAMSHGLLFWRSFTHWVGGMGVLVFVMAILPMSDGHTMHILRAEMPGPTAGKLVSRMSDTAKILYGMYFVMTLVMIGLLLLGGMDLFDASVHAFGAAGTGGFSSRNASVGAYNSAYIDVVTGIGMLAFGINFNLYYFLLMRRFRDVAKSEELWAYLGIVAFSTVTIAANIRHLYGAVGTSLRHAFFQVSSIITTTGFSSCDFDLWPTLSKEILVMLMFIGACAGSTGGGIKVTTLFVCIWSAIAYTRNQHPTVFRRRFSQEVRDKALMIFLMGLSVVLVSTFLLCMLEPDASFIQVLMETTSAFATVGLSCGLTGGLSGLSKLVLILTMYIGRLGPLTVATLWIVQGRRNSEILRPEETISVG